MAGDEDVLNVPDFVPDAPEVEPGHWCLFHQRWAMAEQWKRDLDGVAERTGEAPGELRRRFDETMTWYTNAFRKHGIDPNEPANVYVIGSALGLVLMMMISMIEQRPDVDAVQLTNAVNVRMALFFDHISRDAGIHAHWDQDTGAEYGLGEAPPHPGT
jgi:hypothetical protein